MVFNATFNNISVIVVYRLIHYIPSYNITDFFFYIISVEI
jgi:hypothetical protein